MDLISKRGVSRADEAVAALQQIMSDAQSNRELLLAYVLGGKFKFVNTLHRELRGMAVNDEMIRWVWGWMFARRGPNPKAEFEQLLEARYQRQLLKDAQESAMEDLYDKARRRRD